MYAAKQVLCVVAYQAVLQQDMQHAIHYAIHYITVCHGCVGAAMKGIKLEVRMQDPLACLLYF